MFLDTETASAILKASAQSNAVAEEATRRVVELMQESLDYRKRITELEAALAWYADRDMYFYRGMSGTLQPSAVVDGGELARQILPEWEVVVPYSYDPDLGPFRKD